MLLWGNGTLNAALSEQYLSPGYSDTLAQGSRIAYLLPLTGSGVIQNLFVRQNIPGVGPGELVYRLEVNGVPTDLAVEIPINAVQAANRVDEVEVDQEDVIALVVEGGFTMGTPPGDVVVTAEYVRTA